MVLWYTLDWITTTNFKYISIYIYSLVEHESAFLIYQLVSSSARTFRRRCLEIILAIVLRSKSGCGEDHFALSSHQLRSVRTLGLFVVEFRGIYEVSGDVAHDSIGLRTSPGSEFAQEYQGKDGRGDSECGSHCSCRPKHWKCEYSLFVAFEFIVKVATGEWVCVAIWNWSFIMLSFINT